MSGGWVEMRPRWWGYALEAAKRALETNRTMHPFEKEVHDVPDADCESVVRRLSDAVRIMDARWPCLYLRDWEVVVIRQGLVDLRFDARNDTPEYWRPETRWSAAGAPDEHEWVWQSLRATGCS